MKECPKDYQPGCCCSQYDDEPDENCHVHGYPDMRRCVYCSSFVSRYEPCKKCGCNYHVEFNKANDEHLNRLIDFDMQILFFAKSMYASKNVGVDYSKTEQSLWDTLERHSKFINFEENMWI